MNFSKYIGGITNICCTCPSEIIFTGREEFILECVSIVLKLGHFINNPRITVISKDTDGIKTKIHSIFQYHDWMKREPLLTIQYFDFSNLKTLQQHFHPINMKVEGIVLLSDRTGGFENLAIQIPAATNYEESTLSNGTKDLITIAQLLFQEKNPINKMSWDELPYLYKEQYIYQAAHHLIKISILGYTVNINNSTAANNSTCWSQIYKIVNRNLETLSELEHNRWWAIMLGNGYQFGYKRDIILKTHPDMKPYSELDETTKQKDRDMILNCLSLFQKIGLLPLPK